MAIDKVTLEILGNHCAAAAESMAFTLLRTAHSTFVKESEDFTTGLATPEGKTFASPLDLGATWFVGLDYGRGLALVDRYEEGDICFTNDPYSGFVCTHSPDGHVWKPIFYEGELVCFAVGHIHNTDVGGAVPASLSRTLTEVHQEGIRIPPTKLYKAGILNQELVDILLANVRVPEQNWGDLKAQVAALNTGERKVQEMVARFGLSTFREGMAGLLDYADSQARAVIRRIPNGQYFFADYMDEDSADGHPARIALNLVVDDEMLVFDYSESDPQLTSSLNIPTGGDERHVLLMVAVVYVLYTLDPSILRNSGLTWSSRCILPEGSIVNPQFPAAVGMRSLACNRLMSTIFGAFAQALPEHIAAGPGDGGPLLNVRTTDNRTGRLIMANINPIMSGAGGRAAADGADGSGANHSFFKNTPVEINEAEVPIKILKYGLAMDSGGAGAHRGGLATSLEFQVFAPNTVLTARNRDRIRFTPWGIDGGEAGKSSVFTLNPGSNHEVDLANTDVVTVEPGDRISITAAGAGGWGRPAERPPEAVLTDVKRGFVSVVAAAAEYGVVVRDGTVDEAATAGRRAEMEADSPGANGDDGYFGHNEGRRAFERMWTRENYRTLSEILGGLPVHWRFYVKHKLFDALETMPPGERAGAGEEVRRAFAALLDDQPRLADEIGHG